MKLLLLILACCLWTRITEAQTNESAKISACIAAAHEKSATAAAESRPSQGFCLLTEGVALDVRSGNLDRALTTAKKLVADNPASSPLQAVLGYVYYQQWKNAEAAASFNRALQLDPCNGRVHYFAWRFDALGGKQVAAQQQLQLAHSLAPNDAVIQKTWDAIQIAQRLESEAGAALVQMTKPPVNGFFTKLLSCDGLPIRSSAAVDDTALVLACGRIRTMLANLPNVRRTMISHGAEFHVIGDREGTTDLPENRRFKSEPYIDAEGKSTNMDQRARGVGGLFSSCGEENLLHLPNDRYGDGSDTCTHEFSHDIMESGFTEKQRGEIEKQYRASLGKGLWKGSYAASNVKEFWAEISMWYFGSHGSRAGAGPSGVGRDALRTYDADAYALADRLYSGQK